MMKMFAASASRSNVRIWYLLTARDRCRHSGTRRSGDAHRKAPQCRKPERAVRCCTFFGASSLTKFARM